MTAKSESKMGIILIVSIVVASVILGVMSTIY